MALMTCPACAAQTSDQASHCHYCNQPLHPSAKAPIRQLGGKFAAVGVAIMAFAIIGSALGIWWSPVAILPGVVLFVMAKML